MIVHDIYGNTYLWKLTGRLATGQKYTDRKRSKLHLAARDLISEIFPTLQVLEEVSIKIYPAKKLYLDFYLPLIKLAIEVNGEQHYKFSSLYHKNRWDFYTQKQNDTFKQQWCDINDIDMIALPYNEKTDEWRRRLSCSEDG